MKRNIINVDEMLREGCVRPGEVIVLGGRTGSGRGYSIEPEHKLTPPRGVKPPFKVGDLVRLNDEGMTRIGGLKTSQQVRDSQKLVVTGMTYMGGADHVWDMDVEPMSIGQFLLTDDCLDRRIP